MTERVKTVADYLQLWRSLAPGDYTDPIESKASGQGLDPIAAGSAMASALEAQGELHTQAYYIRPFALQTAPEAQGEAMARVIVQVTRSAPADYVLLLPMGTVFEAVQLGTHGQEIVVGEFQLDPVQAGFISGGTDAVYLLDPLVLDYLPGVPVTANLAGYWGNVAEGLITRFKALGRASVPAVVTNTTTLTGVPVPGVQSDAFLLSHVGRYVRVAGGPTVENPRQVIAFMPGVTTIDPPLPATFTGLSVTVEVEEWADLGLSVTQPLAAEGGISGYLDAAATDRNTGRRQNETDEALRDRLVNQADTISPAAIKRTIQSIFSPRGWRLLETQVVAELKGVVFDLDAYDFGQVGPIVPHPGTSTVIGEGAVMLATPAHKRFFVVLVEPGNEGEFGFGYDSPMVPDSNAWDWAFFDGYPVGFNSLVAQLYDALDRARAAGVGFSIVRDWTL